MDTIEELLACGEKVLWRSDESPVDLPKRFRREKIGFLILFLVSFTILSAFFGYFLVFSFEHSGEAFSPVAYVIYFSPLYVMLAAFFYAGFYWLSERQVAYKLLREWYAEGELAHYTQFIAITSKHVVKKFLDVAAKQVSPQDFGWRGFRRAREKRSLVPILAKPSPELASIITMKEDVEIISTAAIARVQLGRVPTFWVMVTEGLTNNPWTLLKFSLADPSSSLAPASAPALGGFVAETALLVRNAIAEDFIAALQSLNPSLSVADSQLPPAKEKMS